MAEIEFDEMFTLVYRFVTETSENIFLTGKAGTGKTTLLKYIQQNCTKHIVIAAPTGVAAINAGGVTLHSLFQLPFHPFLPTAEGKQQLLGKLKFPKPKQDLLRKMELLVIDEISMVRADVLDAIDTILRSIRRNHAEPFGGVQILCIGDLYQLPPVAQHHEWSLLQTYYSSPFFFDSLAVKEQMPLLLELQKIHRQKQDSFVKLLNKVRNNDMHEDDYEMLHERFIPNFREQEFDTRFITLTSHNRQADTINQSELNKLIAPASFYEAEVDGEFSESAFPAEKKLELKVGAQVMFLKNDTIGKQYYNGKIGVISSLEDHIIKVLSDDKEIIIEKETWENTRYTVDKATGRLEQEVVGTFTQYALRLAWAITIHKSQGLTFSHVMIDAGSAFSSGQVYVALSRCTSLEGIVLLSRIPSSAILSNETIDSGQQQLVHKGSLADRFQGARQVFTQTLLEEIFLFRSFPAAAKEITSLLTQYNSKIQGNAEQLSTDLSAYSDKLYRTGYKFLSEVSLLLKNNPVAEENDLFQDRIKAATAWFLPEVEQLKNTLQLKTISTELKEVAAPLDEVLTNLFKSTHHAAYLIGLCKNGFHLIDFLKEKLNYVAPKYSVKTYYSGSLIQTNGQDELLETLFRWRNEIVEDTGIPIYMVCNKNSLLEIAERRPLTKKHLEMIAGFGKAKVAKYGDEILEIVTDYCERYGVDTEMENKLFSRPIKQAVIKKGKTDKIPSNKITLDFFKNGLSIEEIALERNMATSTIGGHLAQLVGEGHLKVTDLIDEDLYQKIAAVIASEGLDNGYKSIKDKLDDSVFYYQISAVSADLETKKIIENIE